MIAITWSETFLGILKDNDVRLIGYVRDNVLTPLIKGVTADNYFLSVNATRDRLFRQDDTRGWDSVMARIRAALDTDLRRREFS